MHICICVFVLESVMPAAVGHDEGLIANYLPTALANKVCSVKLVCSLQTPPVFVSKYKSAASFSTKSCQLSVNTTDHFSKVLYSGGKDVTYKSVKDFMAALTDGSFALGMLLTQQFVQVCESVCL